MNLPMAATPVLYVSHRMDEKQHPGRSGSGNPGWWFASMALAFVATAANPAAAQGPMHPVTCDSAAPPRARCGLLAVPEDHARRDGRQINIYIVVLPAAAAPRHDDPVLVLLGGPGDAASRRLDGLATAFAAVNASRDIVFVDQRGVARSTPIGCVYDMDARLQGYIDAFLPLEPIRDCVSRAGARADLTRYRTRDFVADLEDVRAALGVTQWNLHGTSYGTRIALQYMTSHPKQVRSAVLQGVVPPALVTPVPYGSDSDHALDLVAGDCTADPACAVAFPHFRAEVDSVVRRLARAPAPATIPNPKTGAPTTVRVTRAAFGEFVRAAMYTPAGARTLPLDVHDAFRGDYSAIAAGAVRRQRTSALEGWTGLYLGVTCLEDLPRVDAAAAAAAEARNRSSVLGDSRLRQHLAACALWPRQSSDDAWPPATTLTMPVLMLVGEADPATPPPWARAALAGMTHGQLVIVPHGGHGFAGLIGAECVSDLVTRFFAAPEHQDASCLAGARRPPFAVAR